MSRAAAKRRVMAQDDDEDSTPPPVTPSPHKTAVAAIANLSLALNGLSVKLGALTRTIEQVGLTAKMSEAVEGDLVEAGDGMHATAAALKAARSNGSAA